MEENKIKKISSGMTLAEVLVSIVVVGVIGVCMALMFVHRLRIDSKTTRNENMSSALSSIFDEFSVDPNNFLVINSTYTYDSETKMYNIKIYYDESFREKVENSNNYLDLFYSFNETNHLYHLDATIYINNEKCDFDGTISFVREQYGA